MTTSIDSNVLAALWDEQEAINLPVKKILQQSGDAGRLVVSGIVYAELLAAPGRTAAAMDYFFDRTRIDVEWEIGERVLRRAGEAFSGYILRRRKSHAELPRRILTDFLIGGYAEVHGYSLLTLDRRLYKAAFPNLRVVTV